MAAFPTRDCLVRANRVLICILQILKADVVQEAFVEASCPSKSALEITKFATKHEQATWCPLFTLSNLPFASRILAGDSGGRL